MNINSTSTIFTFIASTVANYLRAKQNDGVISAQEHLINGATMAAGIPALIPAIEDVPAEWLDDGYSDEEVNTLTTNVAAALGVAVTEDVSVLVRDIIRFLAAGANVALSTKALIQSNSAEEA